MTSVDSEVFDWDDEPIPGLYAAPNSAAHIMGLGYTGGGATIDPNLVFGYVDGRRAAGASL